MNINTEQFNGPLDLLVQMIDDDKLDINDVSLGKIADQFVNYIKNNPDINPEEVADFLAVAAKLLLIKSKTLLPYLIREEEEEEIKDFANQLKIYKDFLEASKKIEEILEERKFMYAREFNKKMLTENVVFYPPKNVNKTILRAAFKEIIGRLKIEEKIEENNLEKAVSIEDKMLKIQNLLKKINSLSFNSLLEEQITKIDIIVSFLAMLELMKQRSVIVEQGELFESIQIIKV
ncbi:MAG: segregation/condensation protein A [Patescibacteria group bacterium]|jgi:segregation and condensation protein A